MSSSSGNSHLIRYYSKLIETYIQLSLYEEAEATATRVLAVDPSNLIVRLKRGHARRRAGHLVEALADFETVLSIPPKLDTAQALHYDEALRQRDIVVDILGCSYLELAYAHPSQIAEYNAPSISLSSNEARPGIPLRASLDEPLPTNCRFYNHLGCRRGQKCLFSHAPDTRSIRDDLGKNVCLYHLVGKCKWDSFTCIYSHSKDNLPSEHVMEDDTSKVAWWANPARIEAVRQLIEKRDARRKKVHEQMERAKKRNIDNNKKSKKKRDNNSDNKDSGNRPPDTNTAAGNRPADSSSSSNSNCDETLVIDWESDSESEGELQFEDVESPNLDLLSYGIKPWEHEEAKALAVALDNLHT